MLVRFGTTCSQSKVTRRNVSSNLRYWPWSAVLWTKTRWEFARSPRTLDQQTQHRHNYIKRVRETNAEARRENSPFRMPSKFVTEDCNSVDGSASLEMSLDFFWRGAVIHLGAKRVRMSSLSRPGIRVNRDENNSAGWNAIAFGRYRPGNRSSDIFWCTKVSYIVLTI